MTTGPPNIEPISGQYNFDEIRYIVVRDANLIFELFKKGELDTYNVNRSKIWVQELNTDRFKQGLLVKRKVFNNYPANIQFMAFNTRRTSPGTTFG